MTDFCSKPSCSKPGTRKCSGCRSAKYCSRNCQRSNWSAHKAACQAATQYITPKSNCYILRAAPQNPNGSVLDNIADQIEPFNLSDLGNEVAEKRQLQEHLGWNGSTEVGKFYDHKGSDGWYYYVYGDARAFEIGSGLPFNEVAGLICHKQKVYGDIGIVRSGPLGSEYPEEFEKGELVKAVQFYKTNDKDKIFSQREMSRTMRSWGVPGGGAGVAHAQWQV
jgi:MYND finger